MAKYDNLIGVEQKETPTCEEGESCDPHENPGHHIDIFIGQDILRPVRALLKRLKAAHAPAMDVWHESAYECALKGGNVMTTCLDCRAIVNAELMLRRIVGKPL